MSEFLSSNSSSEFPILPRMTAEEVDRIAQTIIHSPDIIRRAQDDPSGSGARNKLLADAADRDIKDLYGSLPPIDEISKLVIRAYDSRLKDPADLTDPDY